MTVHEAQVWYILYYSNQVADDILKHSVSSKIKSCLSVQVHVHAEDQVEG